MGESYFTGELELGSLKSSLHRDFFFGKFCLKIQNQFFKVKFDDQISSNTLNSMVMLILCFTGNTLFGQIWPKKSSSQFKLEVGTDTNSNMKNSMVMFSFSVFDRKDPFLGEICFKNQNCLLKLKFKIQINSNKQSDFQHYFHFQTGNILFRLILSKNSKLSV